MSKKKLGKRKNIGVIRALDVRLVQAEHANSFKFFKSIYVSNENQEIRDFLKDKLTEYVSLKLRPKYFVDPVSLVFGHRTHQSWLEFEGKALEKALKRVDVFQIQEPFFLYSGQVARLARKQGKPLVCAPWMSFNHMSSYLPPYSFSVRQVIEQTDLFVLRSNKVNEYLDRFKIPSSKRVMIYHGINAKRFYPRKTKKKDEKIRILFVGQLVEYKGINDVLDVFPKLIKESKQKIELVVCGKGPLEKRVKEMAEEWPIDYRGQVLNSSLPSIYREADVFVGPSRNWVSLGIKRAEEGFGFVFAEAMATGLPIVTYDTGTMREIVGDNNMINDEGDKEALLKSLWELTNDEALRKRMGLGNRERVEKKFDLDKQVKKEEEKILKYV